MVSDDVKILYVGGDNRDNLELRENGEFLLSTRGAGKKYKHYLMKYP